MANSASTVLRKAAEDNGTADYAGEDQPDVPEHGLGIDPGEAGNTESRGDAAAEETGMPSGTLQSTATRKRARAKTARTATKPTRTAKAAGKAKATKTKAKPKAGNGQDTARWSNSSSSGPLPDVNDLRLAPNGVRASEKSRYVDIEFTNGFVVHLFPASVVKEDVTKVRDLVAEWLQRKLAR